MSYKKLGEYIRKVDLKNRDGKILNLQGLSMTKEFRKSTSNIIGTDLSTYKVVKDGQFCCDFMSVIRVHKLPVVLNNLGEDVIISPAYVVFEIKDQSLLLPEYLMMWFRRSEFDRYADFRCDSSIRGGFQWEELCEVELPIPSIEEQIELVKQYHTISDKIKVNEQICEKLETTAQTLYKHWFLDFEFPNEEGKPYKSSGGKMVFNEELEKEIPEGWEPREINSICTIGSSKRIYEYEYVKNGIPFYRGKEITLKKDGKSITEPYFISENRYLELVGNYGKPQHGDILMTAVGTIGSTYMVEEESFYFKDGNIIWFKDFKMDGINYFLYDFMQSLEFKALLNEITIGSTQSAITISTFGSQKLIAPDNNQLSRYKNKSQVINRKVKCFKKQNQKLTEFRTLLLSRLATLHKEKKLK